MKKKKYLYLLLLLILPIIFFGVAKISLNSGNKTNTEGKILTDDTLAAAPYTYYSCKKCNEYSVVAGKKDKEHSIKWYENDKNALATWYMTHYVKCGTVQKKPQKYCYVRGKIYQFFKLDIYNAKNNCSSSSKAHNSSTKINGEECTTKTANNCSQIPVEICSKYSASCKEGLNYCENKTNIKVFTAKFYSSDTSKGTVSDATKTCSGNVNTGCTVNLPTVTAKSGYKFSGWSLTKDCKQISIASNFKSTAISPIKGDIYYACFNKKTTTSGTTKTTKKTKTTKQSKPSSPAPVTPVQTPSITTEPINGTRYAKANASAGGYEVSCGDEVYVTTCETSGANPTCIVTKVNGVAVNTTTKVYRNLLVPSYDVLPENCKNQTRYTLRTTEFYSSESEINKKTSDKISCAEKVTINGSVTSACSYSNNQYCKVTYNSKEGFVYRNNLTSRVLDKSSCADEKQVEARCYHNETEDKYIWSEEDLSNKYAIEASVQTEDECNALNGDGEKNCKTSDKQADVTDTSKKIKICYEKKNNKITDATDVMDMFTCAKDYTQNPVELTENTCDKVKNGTCHKTYLVSCSNGTRPAIEITASLLNQGLGTITIKGRKITNDVKSYYLDNSENPTVDSVWKDFADSNAVAYEQKEAGLYYAWVKDDKGILSRPMFAIVHDADITNTLQTLSVKDANDVAVTLNSIEGENAYLDVMPSEYSLLSNRLKNDKTLAGFDSLSMGYKIEVNSSKISVFATLTSSDASYVEGYEPRTVDLDYGENKILIKIKNKEGKVRTYTIIATRTDNRVSNNLLTDLTVSKGKIEFDPYVTDYNIEVPKNTKKVSINGTLASDTSSFVEGNEPREIELTEDITTSVLEVISESGITRSYVLTFIKKGAEEETSTSAYLDTLTIEGTALDFNKEIYEYSVTVPYEYSSVNVYAFPESDNAFATVEGDRGLKVGANNLKITVKNGKQTKSYTVTVIRKEAGLEISNDVTLSSLTIKDYGIDFSPEKLDYTVKIKREKSLVITATPTSSRSEVYMYGNNSLTGFSTVRIKVVAENGATNIYSIDIQKDSYNKVLEITAVIIGSVIILGTGIIIVVRKKHKKMKEYLGK